MVGGHVMCSMEHTTYSYTTKYVPVRLMLFIFLKNGLGPMDGDIENSLCMDPCAENIWSSCGAEFGPICGSLVVLKRALYGLKTSSK